MKIINATPKDKEELLSLYHAMIGGPCEWSENYPDENTIAFDLKNEDLFVMKNDKKEIVATISIDHDDAVEALTCWRADLAPSGELSRLCVRKDMQGQGIAKTMMNYACDVLKSRGMKGVHILVREGHVVALSTYAKIGFETVGECDLLISISYVWNGDSKEVDIASYRMQLQLYCNIMGVYCLMSYRDETFLLYKNDEWRCTE